MTQQSDSTAAATPVQGKQHTATHHQSGYRSPWDIIKTLPETATPWQQDSAIRANYKFPQVDWAHYRNPLRTPTTRPTGFGKMNMSRPMYYSHSLVQPDSIYRPEYATYRQGVAGDPSRTPSPATISSLQCSLPALSLPSSPLPSREPSSTGSSRTSSIRSAKAPPRSPRPAASCASNSSCCCRPACSSRWCYSSIPQLCRHILHRAAISHGWHLHRIFLLYFGVKALLYAVVNWIFFDRKKNEQWNKSMLFLSSIEGIALFPMVMLSVYFNLSLQTTVVYTAIVVILVKLLAFYKSYLIFFRKTSVFVQSFLYFCALELMPLGSLWGVLVLTDYYLKINF